MNAKPNFEERLLSALLANFDNFARPKPSHAKEKVLAGAVVAAAVMAGVALPLALHASARPAKLGTTLRLASYSLRLPTSYHQVDAAPLFSAPNALFGYEPVAGATPPALQTQPSEPRIVAAVDQTGGWVSMALSGSYTPGEPDAPFLLEKPSQAQQIQIDGYNAVIGSGSWVDFRGRPVPGYGRAKLSGQLPVYASRQVQQVVVVSLPVPGGQAQDLAVIAGGLSESQLVSIVSEGLSLPRADKGLPAPPTPSWPTPPPFRYDDGAR